MHQIITGDCRAVMADMADSSIDSIVTDPPYGLEFMGKDWDAPWKTDRRQVFDGTLTNVCDNPFGRSKVRYGTGGSYGAGAGVMQAYQAWATEIFTEALRVLKPGGHLLTFGGSRTYHRLACAVEDAGFEIRDQIMWLYGSGFPKSQNVGKTTGEPGWQGWGTALKPAHEPIVVARKPLIGTVAKNVLEHGTGALNIDGCRVPTGGRPLRESTAALNSNGIYGEGLNGSKATGATDLGRWPANVIHDGSEEVLAGFPAQTGKSAGGFTPGSTGAFGKSGIYGGANGEVAARDSTGYGDSGSAARFFYCAKASKKDRNAGAENNHPTVKPTELMRYLCRLITPPGGVVFDPFTGSGSTGRGAVLEGFHFTGAELDPEYTRIANARIREAVRQATRKT